MSKLTKRDFNGKIAEKWPNWDHHNIFTYIVEWFLSVYSISTYMAMYSMLNL